MKGNLFNSIIDKFAVVGESGAALYYVDRDLATL